MQRFKKTKKEIISDVLESFFSIDEEQFIGINLDEEEIELLSSALTQALEKHGIGVGNEGQN